MNIVWKTRDFHGRKISGHHTMLSFSDREYGWKTGSIHMIIPGGKSI